MDTFSVIGKDGVGYVQEGGQGVHDHGWGGSVCVQPKIMGREGDMWDVWSRHSTAIRAFLVWQLGCSGVCKMSLSIP